jgi:predicted  nucleic acid-binding Zn-ribbon protein
VPTPDQVPKPVNLKHLPESILKSGAVNTLIQQNEDLLSRLSIHLRRYAKLEEELEARSQEIHRLTANESHWKDQVLIVERKAELIEERTKDTRTENENLRRDVQLLETRYSELYARSKEQIEGLRNEKELYRKKSERLARYRHRIFKDLKRDPSRALKNQI